MISNHGKVTRALERLRAFVLALSATLVALPANASFEIPNDPLTTGARVPPNILFILDDSGSMAFDAMPANSLSSWYNRSYANNVVYYDPNKDYQPWVDATGAPLTGGTEYESVFGSYNLASGTTINLFDSSSCGRFNRNQSSATRDEWPDSPGSGGSGTRVCGGVQTFYVPIDPNGDLRSEHNFYRYQIHPDGRIIRSQWLERTGTGPDFNNGLPDSGCPERTDGTPSSEPFARWRDCQRRTPTGRSEEAERRNYAIWFSYHRTRMKAAKAGASAAFSELGGDVRVGFRTIWQRDGITGGNWPTQSVPIPVQYNDGRFEDVARAGVTYDNRTKWYRRLHDSIGYNGTPLHGALHQAGRYFSSGAADGPYGPQTGSEQLACRQNFAILTTDGYWNSSSNYPSNQRVGNADGTNGPTITEPDTGASFTYSAVAPYADSHTGDYGTLADVAMHYWKSDLRPTLPNIVPTTFANPAFWQHMVTFGLSLGLSGSLGFESVADVPEDFSAWPDPTVTEDATRIDDLLHAAVNSRGEFVAASSPEEFTAGLKAALAAIVERTGSFANVSSNSTSLDTESRLYQASYVSGVWSGDLIARPISTSGVGTTVLWRASEGIPTSGRKVFTSEGAFPANMTDEQEAALEREALTEYPVTGAQNASYLVGDRSRELSNGGNLRNRNHVLGAIVSSSPAYVKETDTIYVGSNDGMLHAFDASSGQEVFAFIPDGIDWTDFGSLSRPDYSHRYLVDGPVVVSSRAQAGGRNILVATLGKGGKGLFALDVTSPGSFSKSDVLWQRYETAGGNMGLVQGAPVIAKVPTASGGSSSAVIVSNGINSANNRAVLFVFDLATGSLIREIDTGAGSADEPNGLSGAVGWDADGDGVVDTVYAGDMLGNVWKFDIGGSPSTWGVANDGAPMFVATDSDGSPQPISARVTVGLHPTTFATWVFFGTGRFLTLDDVSDRSVQSMYGIIDNGVVARDSLVARSTVLAGYIQGRPVRSFEESAPLPVTHPVNGGAVNGWYVDLLQPPEQDELGERMISEPQIINRVLVSASIIPMNDACQSNGRGYLNALDAFTGTSLAGGSFFDIDGDGDFADEVIVDDDGNPLPVGSIDLGVGMPTLPNLMRELAAVGGSTGSAETVNTLDARFTGRVSWREEIEE